jgi:hypothetical protein
MHTVTTEHSHEGPSHSHETGIGTPASSASVALDIGGGRGALIIYPSERFRGREIEISRVGENRHRVHTGVHDRTTQTGAILTAIFGSLPAAEYLVWQGAETEGPLVTVPDGAIAELRLT